MASAKKFAMLMTFFALAYTPINAYSTEKDFVRCQSTVKKWAASSLDTVVKEDKHRLRDLLFFLHIPRTGGRSYFHCFLKKLYTNLECPRSYDKLRFDPSKPNCRLMVTHDDYSMVSKLPKERTSVVTILRNPVDRVFSTYEFSVEVAARFLVHSNLTSATQMMGRIHSKKKGVSTLDIWPWKCLVPWMREDLFARRDARKRGDFGSIRESNDPFDMENIVMPLREFINDPVAHDIIHNGATFQVAGLTNNSYLSEADEVRHCVRKYVDLGEYVLEVAKKRLDSMLYIGLTEDHRESATMFSNVVGVQVISQLQSLSSGMEQAEKNKSGMSSSFQNYQPDSNYLQNSINDQNGSDISATENMEETDENKNQMTVGKLMETYEECTSRLRKAQSRRRTLSLKKISPAYFTKEARLQVPEVVLQQILSLNNLDVELYKYAQDIFEQQRKHLMQKSVEVEKQMSTFSSSYGAPLWKILSLGMTVLILLVLLFLLSNARRRTLKVKV
ncbi:protein-tyrosine sulfotransferase-like isoform X1 [Telopea speciosissima]|uniref:protein-tyrosine sulfotransferase-like isoform X1 n=1 Tax=Telopea speciosissima TaxID=54955 RepID=UPI001CC6EE29|nr:protein-tyrosine sulfotransferase-like isoform X1 [Telopea speciosissima]XP_043707322.1 protein-tyrosine sulfotransferase-like isoform X1 [Telopea speciosissima]